MDDRKVRARRRLVTLGEPAMIVAFDKDALQLRGAASVLHQFLGVAGVTITLRIVG